MVPAARFRDVLRNAIRTVGLPHTVPLIGNGGLHLTRGGSEGAGQSQNALALRSWAWLEFAAAALLQEPAVIIGDLNVRAGSNQARGAEQLQRIRQTGWILATSKSEPSYFSAQGSACTLDYLLHTPRVRVSSASFVTTAGGHILAGGEAALSDHAAIVAILNDEFTQIN